MLCSNHRCRTASATADLSCLHVRGLAPLAHCHHIRARCDAALLPSLVRCQPLRRTRPSRRWLVFMAMWPTVPARISLIPQWPVACARLNYELTAMSCHGNDEPSHVSFPPLVSSVAMVVGPTPSIRCDGVTSVQLTLPMSSLCSQPATRHHLALILAVPCSNLELSSRQVDKNVLVCIGGKAPTPELLAFDLLHR